MKNIIKSALLTAVAVPFLFAAPAKKAQNSAASAGQTAPATKKAPRKHHAKKAAAKSVQTDSAASAPAK